MTAIVCQLTSIIFAVNLIFSFAELQAIKKRIKYAYKILSMQMYISKRSCDARMEMLLLN